METSIEMKMQENFYLKYFVVPWTIKSYFYLKNISIY